MIRQWRQFAFEGGDVKRPSSLARLGSPRRPQLGIQGGQIRRETPAGLLLWVGCQAPLAALRRAPRGFLTDYSFLGAKSRSQAPSSFASLPWLCPVRCFALLCLNRRILPVCYHLPQRTTESHHSTVPGPLV